MVNSITKPGFEDLNLLISKVGLIMKIMVLIDDIDNLIALVVYLRSLLPPNQGKYGNVLI